VPPAEIVPYTCPDITCDAYGQQWPVEVDHNGASDEPSTRCPDCYGPGMLVVAEPLAA
jgi:hypothetical protein